MSIYQDCKPLSLVEQKKIQWAKEREELAKLSVPWGKSHLNSDKINSRPRELAKIPKDELPHTKEKCIINNLPPINRNNKIYETEGETSGYATDSVKEATPEHYENYMKKSNYEIWTNWNKASESEASSFRGERPKWRDRECGLKQSSELQSASDNYAKKMEPPAWLQRGLKNNKEVLVICHSPEQYEEYFDRPQSTEDAQTYTNMTRTHLRGQNIPLEPTEIAERDIKRQKALELQKAIKQQLEEREIKRRQEREKRIRDEVEEELRISREQEIERQRIENEQRLLEEKKEREQKRNKAMHEAIENAERLAKLEKSKYKHVGRASSEISCEQNEMNSVDNEITEMKSPRRDEMEYLQRETEHSEVNPTQNVDLQKGCPSVNDNLINNNYNLVLPNTYDNVQSVQLALLVPAINVSNGLPISLPVSISNENYAITENRVLTPTIYKMRKSSRESSTQTDNSYFLAQENNKSGYYKNSDKYYSLERRSTYSNDKREFKLERNKESKSEKPKWGANRPPTRYMKQSEKDPLYQKRKLRQKMREMKLYEDKNNNYSESSDDSMSNTSATSTCRKQNTNRNLWHKNERMFSQNISVYQTEIVPLEVDEQGRIYVVDRNGYTELHTDRLTVGTKCKERTPDLNTIHLITRKELWDHEQKEKSQKRMSDSDTTTDNEGLLEKLKTLRQGLLLKKVDGNDVKKFDVDLPALQKNS